MSFEQYQFLRYYLPGSLLLLYVGMILAPLSSLNLIASIREQSSALVSLALGGFVLGPVLGYMIYAFYDTVIYNWRFMDWKNRKERAMKAEYDRFIEALKRSPRFQVREGRLQKIGTEFRQKRVDVYLAVDLVKLSCKAHN